MMALNIAVPLTTVGELMDGFGLLSPISPLSVDCRDVVATTPGSHGKSISKQLVSPVGSESSGVSSLDSDEIKKPTSPPTTPTEEMERPTSSSPIPAEDETIVQQQQQPDSPSASSSSPSSRSSLSSSSSSSDSDSGSNSSSEHESTGTTEVTAATTVVAVVAEEEEDEEHALLVPELPPKELKLVIGGRDVLNLMDNLTAPNHFRLQFAQLPENDNIHFFLDNRSQYHRLGANGHIQEYTMVGCKRCDFRFPVNGTSLTSGGPTATMGQSSLAAAAYQQQQQQQSLNLVQQQQQQQTLNSIANSRDKMSLNAAAAAVNAFNKTFASGGGAGGSQYFRNGGGNAAAAAGLFGRDSNRNGAANFLNASTGTYNNHKTYQQQQQQSFNTSKFNAAQFGNYQAQQQQQFFPKNHQMRYGGGAGQSSLAATLANQNLVNFNSFGGKNSTNNSNMFAYYKTMM